MSARGPAAATGPRRLGRLARGGPGGHDALPLLRLAEEVVILIVDASNVGAASATSPEPAPGPSETA